MRPESPVLISQTYQRVSQETNGLIFLPWAVYGELKCLLKILTTMRLEFVGGEGESIELTWESMGSLGVPGVLLSALQENYELQ